MSIKDTLISLKIKAENLLSKDTDKASDSLEELKNKSKDLRTHLKELEDQKTLIKQFQAQEAVVNKNNDAFKTLSDRAYTLRARIKETGDPTGQFAVQLERVQAAAKKSSDSLKTKSTTLNKLKTSLKSANLDTDDLAKSEAKLTKEITKSKTVLASFAKSMRTLSTETKAVEKEAKSFSFVKAGYWTAGVIGVTAFARNIKDLAVDMLTTGDKFEGLRIQMNALMGSIEEGERATEWIKEFTQTTPLQVEQVTETFARLKAFGLDPMDGTMQTIIDQSEKLGGGMERVEGISLALGQAWAKQKLQGEEILQLVERGVPVWDLLEKATGRNTLELQKLSSQGKLGRDVIKQLTAEIGKSADGAAAANMSRMTGLVSNLKDQWQLFLNQIAESGALDYVKQQLSELNQTIKEMSADGSLKKWAQDISDAFISFVAGVKSAGEWMYKFKDAIIDVGSAALKIKLATMFVGFAAATVKAIASLFAVETAVVATTAKAKILSNVLKTSLVGALAFTGTQIYRVVDAWKDMTASEEAALESSKLAEETTKAKAAKLKELSNQLGINITTMEQFLELEEKGIIVFDEATASYKKANAEIEKQAELQKQNAAVLAESLIPTVDRLKLKFEELQREGLSASDAIATISDSMDVGETESIQAVVDALAKLKEQGQITSNDIETGLRIQLKALADKELATLKANAPETFTALGISIQSVANEVDPLRDHFTKLGLDLNQLRGGFTETGNVALSAFKSIANSATASADEIAFAFDATFEKISTQSELDNLEESIVNLGKEGKLSGDKIAVALALISEKSAKTTADVDTLTVGVEKLGTALERNQARAKAAKIGSDLLSASYQEQEAAISELSSALERNAARAGLAEAKRSEARAEASSIIAEASDKEVVAVNNSGDALNELGNVTENVAESTNQMSEVIMASADSADLASMSIGGLSDKIAELERRIYDNRQVFGAWFKQIATEQIVFDKQTLGIAKQTQKLLKLQSAFSSTEAPTLAMINNTASAVNNLKKLDASQLTSLNAQIDSARQKLESLQASAQSALSSVQDELDTLNGNTADIEIRSYESKIATLTEQLNEAKLYKDSQAIVDLKETIKLTEQLHKQKLSAIEAENVATSSTSTASTSASTETAGSSSSQTVTVKLELGGQTATINTDADGKDDLLKLLQQSALVTG